MLDYPPLFLIGVQYFILGILGCIELLCNYEMYKIKQKHKKVEEILKKSPFPQHIQNQILKEYQSLEPIPDEYFMEFLPTDFYIDPSLQEVSDM